MEINEQNLIGFVRVYGVDVCIRGRERNKKTEEFLPNPIKYFFAAPLEPCHSQKALLLLPGEETHQLTLPLSHTHTHICVLNITAATSAIKDE